MKNLFLPYNLALLAKEKGFDEPCLAYFFRGYVFNLCSNPMTNTECHKEYSTGKKTMNSNPNNDLQKTIVTPLYQQITDWFREKHGIQFAEFPWKIGNPVRYGLHRNGEFLGGFELDKAIETAFKLI